MRRIVPDKTHYIDQTPLRQFSIDGSLWFPLVDVCRLLETSRSATQMALALPREHTRRVQVTERPPTHMISEEGLLNMVEHSVRAQNPETRAGRFRAWCHTTLNQRMTQITRLSNEITLLQGEIDIKSAQLQRETDRLTKMVTQLDRLRTASNA